MLGVLEQTITLVSQRCGTEVSSTSADAGATGGRRAITLTSRSGLVARTGSAADAVRSTCTPRESDLAFRMTFAGDA